MTNDLTIIILSFREQTRKREDVCEVRERGEEEREREERERARVDDCIPLGGDCERASQNWKTFTSSMNLNLNGIFCYLLFKHFRGALWFVRNMTLKIMKYRI